jgi:hypothetical protein
VPATTTLDALLEAEEAGFESDDDRAAFFDEDEFATPVTWETATGDSVELPGLLNVPVDSESGFATVEVTQALPSLLCRTRTLPATAAQGDRLFVEGTWWRAREIRPDATGMAVIDLEKA